MEGLREMAEKKPLDEVIREDMKKTLEDRERRIVQRNAESKMHSSKKYILMLSLETMVIVLLVGAFAVGCMIASGFRNMELMNDSAAYIDWGFAAFLGIVVLLWIGRSIILQKQFKVELSEYISSGKAKRDYEQSIETPVRKATDIYIKYRIETFERLRSEEMSLADEEWDELLYIATDRFYRMGSMMFSNGKELFQIYAELRYQKPDEVNFNQLRAAEDTIEYKLQNLKEHDPSTHARAFKDDIREIIRQELAERFPYFRIDEICIAMIKIS